MAEIADRPTVSVSATFILNEAELRALDALAGYGDDSFLRTFYEKMGVSYLRPHEAGLLSLFAAVRSHIPGLLARADKARKAFQPTEPVKPEPGGMQP